MKRVFPLMLLSGLIFLSIGTAALGGSNVEVVEVEYALLTPICFVGAVSDPAADDSDRAPGVSCRATPTEGLTGTVIVWSAFVCGVAPFSYSWSGSDDLNGTNQTASRAYFSSGEKSASVEVTSANGQTGSADCALTVTDPAPVPDPAPLNVSCSVSPTSIITGESAEWTASVSGGVTPYTYSWVGAFDINDASSLISWAPQSGTYSESVTVASSDGQSITRSCGLITVHPPSILCGNGIVDGAEQCDEGGSNGACPASCSVSCVVSSCAPTPPQEDDSLIEIVDGSLIRAFGNPDVYIVMHVGEKRFKRLILSPIVFNSYNHLSWGAIQTTSAEVLDSFETSDLVRVVGGNRVWKLYPSEDTGDRRWITDADAFLRFGFDWDSVYEINAIERDSYLLGNDLN